MGKMSEIQCRVIQYKSSEYLQTIELREKILRIPLGLKFTKEYLKRDEHDFHLVAMYDKKVIGCLILTPREKEIVQMRQVAVDATLQGKGIGKKLVYFSEQVSQEKGFKKIILNARLVAVPFYKRLQYKIVSDEFIEVGIPHYKMEKEI